MNNSNQYNSHRNSKGTVRISTQVITSIVGHAIRELDNKAELAPVVHSSTPKWIVFNKTISPVRIELKDGLATISARLLVSPEVKLREYAEQLQQAIKDAIQNMTGIIVSDVNLAFVGLTRCGGNA